MRRALRDVLLGLLLIFFLLPWYLFFGPTPPAIARIRVEGTERIKPEEITRKLRVLEGKPFSGFSTKKAAAALLKDPRIEKTAVRFAFPNELVVWVKEKRFDFILTTPQTMFGLSEKFEIFPLTPEDKTAGRLVISGCGSFPGWYYRPVKSPRMGRLANFLSAVRAEFPEFPDKISQLDFEDPHNVRAYLLENGAELNLGPPPYEPKLELVRQLFALGLPPGNLDLRQENSVYAFLGKGGE
jgi:hypothetical protein